MPPGNRTKDRRPGRSGFRRGFRLNPLLAYDLLLLWRSLAAAFRTWRDVAFLLVGSAATILWIRERLQDSGLAGEPGLLAASGALLGFVFSRRVAGRLAFHASESILAPQALRTPDRRHYILAWAALSSLALATLGFAVGRTAPLPLLAGYLSGLGFGYVAAKVLRAGGPPLRLDSRGRNGPAIERPARGALGYGARMTRSPASLAGAALLSLALAWVAMRQAGALAETIVLAAAVLACLALLTRVDHATVRFLAIAGYGPWRSLAILMAPTALYCAALLLLAILFLGLREVAAAAMLGAGAAALMASRILVYRLHDKARGDLLLTAGWLGIGLIGTAAPPALLLAAPALGVVLVRRSASVTWSMA